MKKDLRDIIYEGYNLNVLARARLLFDYQVSLTSEIEVVGRLVDSAVDECLKGGLSRQEIAEYFGVPRLNRGTITAPDGGLAT